MAGWGGARQGAGRKRRTDIAIGDRFGSFVVGEIVFDQATHVRLICKCGAESLRDASHLKSRRQIKCIDCARSVHSIWGSFAACGREAENRTDNPALVSCIDCKEGHLDRERFAANVLNRVRGSARNRQIECTLAATDVLAVRVGKPCAFCGGEIGGCAGIDRIDSRIGYVIGNVQPCCGPCNAAKGTLEDDEFRAAMAVRLAKTGIGHAWDDYKTRGNNAARR